MVSSQIDHDHFLRKDLIDGVEEHLIILLESGLPIDELVSVIDSIYGHMNDCMSESLLEVVDSVVDYEFLVHGGAIDDFSSSQEFSDYLECIDALAEIVGRDSTRVKEIANMRLANMEKEDSSHSLPGFLDSWRKTHEEFDDDALYSLFSNLISP